MQPTEGYSVARRALDIEDYIDILRRHKGWIFGPFLFILVATVVTVTLWPDSYTSTGMIKIVPQQLPQNMVQATITTDMQDRISAMANEIESRTVLTEMIGTMGLYKKEQSREPMEDIVQGMHDQIHILPVASMSNSGRAVPAFAVQFSYENRYLAQQVVAKLMTRFIDENVRQRSAASYLGVQFFQDQVAAAQKTLNEVEDKLIKFRTENAGRLPDQVQGNIQQLNALTTNASSLNQAISRAQSDLLIAENQLNFNKDRLAQLAKEPVQQENSAAIQRKSQRLDDVDRQIEGQNTLIAALRNKYTDSYPDVQSALLNLEILKKNRDSILKEETDNKKEPVAQPKAVSRETVQERKMLEENINKLSTAIEAKNLDMENATKELKRINDSIRSVDAKVYVGPLAEKQYEDLRRDRELAKDNFEKMKAKMDSEQVGKDMEDRSQGELLQLLDPASLPEHVASPNRPMWISVGAGIGLLLGIAIAGGREVKDQSLKNLKDVRAYTQMSILGSIPLLENDFVVRRRRRLAWLGWTTSCLAAAVVMAGSFVYYKLTQQ